MTRILVVDNYDSFTFNLVQELGALGAQLEVHRNDELSVEDVLAHNPDGILVSPGPCAPDTAGISVPLIRAAAGKIPLLGVCLGHQSIGAAFGATVVRNFRIVHGKSSPVRHRKAGVFKNLPSPFEAGRYHSLVIEPASLPSCLTVTAWTEEGEIMGVRHRRLEVEGVQFHPESVLTPEGRTLLQTWLSRVERTRR